MKRLTAKNYLATIKDKTKLKDLVVLTIHDWIVRDLTRKKAKSWPTNKSLIYQEKKYDIVLCLPGASMAMITLEEMIACKAKKVIYLGTGAGLKKQPSGTLLINPKVVSVLNPYTEQETINWSKVKKNNIEIIDMESEYLQSVAKARNIDLSIWLIVTDHISKNNWQSLKINKKYKENYKISLNKIKSMINNKNIKN